jgi:hypothetical protein
MEVIEGGTGSIEGTALLFFRSRIKKGDGDVCFTL